MSAIVPQISGSSQMGGVLSAYTVYKIDVSCNGSEWSVHRRYNQFLQLHEALKTIHGREFMETHSFILPPKKLGSTSVSIVDTRLKELQEYLQKILTIEDIDSESEVGVFFDLLGKGISGATRDLGSKSILIETLALVKFHKHYLEFFRTCYVVLSKAGVIYVMRGLDDSISQPLLSFPLREGAMHVFSPSGSRRIDLTRQDNTNKLSLKLSSESQVASWLRLIADFTTRQMSAFDAPKAEVVAQKEKKTSRVSITENIRSEGTGHTTDVLSSMYGV